MKKKAYSPRWIHAKFGYCISCHTSLRDRRAWYYPGTHDILCEKCAIPYVEEYNQREQYHAEKDR